MSKVDVDLGDLLAKVLPTEAKVTIRHVSSAPTPCGALFAAPPGEQPESTFCENHFLTVSVHTPGQAHETENESEKDRDHDPAEIIVFGMEVLVYSTTHLTTIFVSKADSTGYLHLLKLPPRASLLRQISSAFLSYLVQTRQRPGVRLVVSLFARAQNQYLFPGSIENPEKHVLDDRGLIKWWCRVVDPILRTYEPESKSQEKGAADQAAESAKSSATAFLIVPGCDRFETRGFFPASAKADDAERPRWVNSYPVRQLCDNPDAPPRCLIPRLPDDPKTRFLVDLDDELPAQTEEEESTSAQTHQSGQWRSVKSLDQFWEMMSFRQECSAGRLVGFLWLVVNPPGLVNSVQMMSSRPVSGMAVKEASENATTTAAAKSSDEKEVPISTTDASGGSDTVEATTVTADSNVKDDRTPPLQPKSNVTASPAPTKPHADSNAFFWPDTGRGHAVLAEDDYKTAINYLLNQDFYDQPTAIASTRGWGEKVASLADQLWVGQPVVGSNASAASVHPTGATTNLMDAGLVRKRKKTAGEGEKSEVSQEGSSAGTGDATPASSEAGVNVLQAGLIRKKKKT